MPDSHRKSLEDGLRPLHQASYGWALACAGGDEVLAQDALQDAYVKALTTKNPFSGNSSLKTWFFTIVRNATRDLQRRQKRGEQLAEPLDEPDAHGKTGTQELRVRRANDREKLEELFAGLSPREREVLELVYYQNLTLREASAIMGVTQGSASSYLKRAKASLRRDLQRPSTHAPDFSATWTSSLEFVSKGSVLGS